RLRVAAERSQRRCRLTGCDDARAPDHVMEHEAAANGLPSAATDLNVVDFLDLERGDITILGQPDGCRLNFAPPVRSVAFHGQFRKLDDQIWRANRPLG